MRTASTWTFQCLGLHPEVGFPAGKQVHFLDTHLGKGIDWYRGLFAEYPDRFDGDITPAYAIVGEPQVQLLAGAFEDLRVFFVVRDPIERAWSSARLSIRQDELDPQALNTDWFITRLTQRSVRLRNDYEMTYTRWKRHFGERLWVADFAGIQDDAQGYLVALSEHLGIDANFYRSPSPALQQALATPLNTTGILELPDTVDRVAIERATSDAYAADLAWYRCATLDWPSLPAARKGRNGR